MLKIGDLGQRLRHLSERQDRELAFAFLIIAILTYFRSWNVPFHFDDSHSIAENPGVHSLQHIWRYWVDPTWTSVLPDNRVFRPLTFTFYNLLWWIGDGQVWPFHAFKVLLHGSLSFCVFKLSLILFQAPRLQFSLPRIGNSSESDAESPIQHRKLAFFAGTFFVIHPALSESTVYISSLSSSLASFFSLTSLLLALQIGPTASRRKRYFSLAASLLAYSAAVMSKEEGIVVPGLLAVLLWAHTPVSPSMSIWTNLRRIALQLLPFAIFGLALAWIVRQGIPASMALSRGSIEPHLYLATQVRAWLHYLLLVVWPSELNADNVVFGFNKSWLDHDVLEALVIWIVIGFTAWKLRKQIPLLAFSLLFMLISLSPTSSVIPLAEPVNERRMILAFAFLVPAAVAIFVHLTASLQWTSLRRGFMILLGLGFFAFTQYRIEVWNNPKLLWQDVVRRNPENGRAMNNLALQFMREADFKSARELLQRCRQVWPGYSVCALNLGITLDHSGNLPEAEANFRTAITLNPRSHTSYFYFGEFLERRGRWREALDNFQTSFELTQRVFRPALIKMIQIAERSSGANSPAESADLQAKLPLWREQLRVLDAGK